jgi:AcrR family transcriptional regulator
MRTAFTREERRTQTRSELVDAAERLFSEQGFHATSVDQVADDAGYTKGAVYSNFVSKEDLFLAVYERRVDRALPHVEAAFAEARTAIEGLERITAASAARRSTEDGWLAVFFEFWAHVLRHEELRERFAKQHSRLLDIFEPAMVRAAAEQGTPLPEEPRKLAAARYAMQLGLELERLTQPDVVDAELATRMVRLSMGPGGSDGLPDQAPSGHGTRPASKQAARRG